MTTPVNVPEPLCPSCGQHTTGGIIDTEPMKLCRDPFHESRVRDSPKGFIGFDPGYPETGVYYQPGDNPVPMRFVDAEGLPVDVAAGETVLFAFPGGDPRGAIKRGDRPEWQRLAQDGPKKTHPAEIARVADKAQYPAEPVTGGLKVTLINAMPDPLGTLAVMCGLYTGKVYRDLSEVTNDQRRQALDDMMNTELAGALRGGVFHFLIEGVTRNFTHQAVRNQFSFFVEQSFRFAVQEHDFARDIPLPPSLAGLDPDDPMVRIWRKNLLRAEDSYHSLIAAGMPAEEARGGLPGDVVTRYHWIVDLRTLIIEAGKRTCTQAQFHWRQIFGLIAKALRQYGDREVRQGVAVSGWQYALIADTLRPVCYRLGRCGFKAEFDRSCTIRDRVDAFERAGIPSNGWHSDGWCDPNTREPLSSIDPAEWAADPGAARS